MLLDFVINEKEPKNKNIPEFKKICLLDEDDENTELIPENYIYFHISSIRSLTIKLSGTFV